nr:DNA-binding protein [Xylanibacillus composti]
MADRAFEKFRDKIESSKWPPVLSRTKLMEFLGIKETKASELMNRADFPVIREFGHPKVPTHLLLKWIDSHTDWVEENSTYFNRIHSA